MKRLRATLLLFALLGVALAATWAWQRYSSRHEWDQIRPPNPALLGSSAPGFDARVAILTEKIKRWPPDIAALVEFTRVCHANGQLDSAAAGYSALLSLSPEEPRWPYRLASILAGYGRLDEAIPLLRRTTEMAPEYLTAHIKLADALLKSNQTTEAEATYRRILLREEKNPHAMLGLARCDLQAERLTAARSQLQRAVAAHPEFASAQSLLGSVLERLGNAEGAALARSKVKQSAHYLEPADPWLGELINDCHDPYTLLIAASAAVSEGRPSEALTLLDRGLTLDPTNARLHRQLSKTHAVLGESTKALAEMERAVALEPTNDAIHLDLIALLRKEQNSALDEAVAKAVKACPSSAALQFEAGLIAAQSGHWDEAAQFFETAWRNEPDQPAAAYEAAIAYFRGSQPESAVALLEQLLTRLPPEARAGLMLVRHGIQTGDARTPGWLQQTIVAGPPPTVLAELRQDFQRRFGTVP